MIRHVLKKITTNILLQGIVVGNHELRAVDLQISQLSATVALISKILSLSSQCQKTDGEANV